MVAEYTRADRKGYDSKPEEITDEADDNERYFRFEYFSELLGNFLDFFDFRRKSSTPSLETKTSDSSTATTTTTTNNL